MTTFNNSSSSSRGRGQPRNPHGELKEKRPIWLTPTAWDKLEKWLQQQQTQSCRISISECIERLVRQHLAD